MQKQNLKYAIVGSGGQLGNELVRQGKASGIQLVAFDLPHFDITDPVAVEKQLRQESGQMVHLFCTMYGEGPPDILLNHPLSYKEKETFRL